MMNERIKELAMQADPEYTGGEDDNMGHALVGNAAIQRFAELIVNRCYLWAKENGGLGSDADFEALKEHLGVGE